MNWNKIEDVFPEPDTDIVFIWEDSVYYAHVIEDEEGALIFSRINGTEDELYEIGQAEVWMYKEDLLLSAYVSKYNSGYGDVDNKLEELDDAITEVWGKTNTLQDGHRCSAATKKLKEIEHIMGKVKC